MTTSQILLLLVTFIAVSVAAYVVISYFTSSAEARRLQAVGEGSRQMPIEPSPWRAAGDRIRKFLGPLGKLSLPEGAWDKSPLRIRFFNAGFRGSAAPPMYFAAKTLLTFLLPGLFVAYVGISHPDLKGRLVLSLLIALAAIGYYIPNAVMARLIAHRQRELFETFPDALDLMRICVEAGLGLDAAIARVGEELKLQSKALYEELHLVNLELRAGASRERALHNLALRMGLEDVDGLVAMLVQSERFGTSIADSLRVHSEALRVKRRLRAEEAAAKIPVKLLFPLIFCLFPALLVVLVGPAGINIYRVLLPTLAGP